MDEEQEYIMDENGVVSTRRFWCGECGGVFFTIQGHAYASYCPFCGIIFVGPPTIDQALE